jgi:hypothetical protein
MQRGGGGALAVALAAPAGAPAHSSSLSGPRALVEASSRAGAQTAVAHEQPPMAEGRARLRLAVNTTRAPRVSAIGA